MDTIRQLYRQKKPVVSFEVFPPKKDGGLQGVLDTLSSLTGLKPDFISVTYGAGGGAASGKTKDIACAIQADGILSLAHLTCVGASREAILSAAASLKEAGIHNIMALRGDLPEGQTAPPEEFSHASGLIRTLSELSGFCIGGACYPEGHIDCDDSYLDLVYLRQKQDAGADFLISQLFFDNDIFFRFLERAGKAGVSLPVSAGVMPIFSRQQIERMIFMCGASLPSSIVRLLHKYEYDADSLKKAGIEYAVNQIEGLIRDGADGVHLYTMNQSTAAVQVMDRCYSLGRSRP